MKEVKEATYFSVLADEAQNVSNMEQMPWSCDSLIKMETFANNLSNLYSLMRAFQGQQYQSRSRLKYAVLAWTNSRQIPRNGS